MTSWCHNALFIGIGMENMETDTMAVQNTTTRDVRTGLVGKRITPDPSTMMIDQNMLAIVLVGSA